MTTNSLDLHGVRAEAVFDKVDRFMIQTNQKNLDHVRLVCGKGKGIVKKIVIDYLKLAKYHWHYEKLANGKLNEGVILVNLL